MKRNGIRTIHDGVVAQTYDGTAVVFWENSVGHFLQNTFDRGCLKKRDKVLVKEFDEEVAVFPVGLLVVTDERKREVPI